MQLFKITDMKTNLIKYGLLIFSCLLISCKKFLDINPSTTIVNPSTIKDFEEMLNSQQLAECNFFYADLTSDNSFIDDTTRVNSYKNAYLWEKDIWLPSDNDQPYNDVYERILQLNIVLDKLPTIKLNNSEDEGRRRVILAQAKIHRAWFYFQLSNFYGTDYTSGTSASSLAVPLILVPGQVERPKRATVKEVYDQIILDLKDAIATKELPAMGVDIIHPGLAAAHVLLARTYLYMGDYDNALKEAENGLAIKKELLNYKDVKSYPVTLLEQAKNPEVMLAKVGIDEDYYRYFGGFIRGDYELLESFGWNDKRKELAFPNYSNLFLGREGKMTFNYSIGVPEAMFIKAECLARKGQVDAALALLNEIRANRLSGTDNLSSNVNDILPLVFSEKRKEFIFHGGIRLFDLKRMNRDPKLAKTLKRVQRDQWSGEIEKELAELVPNSPRYLMQIAPRIIQNNPAIIPNPR